MELPFTLKWLMHYLRMRPFKLFWGWTKNTCLIFFGSIAAKKATTVVVVAFFFGSIGTKKATTIIAVAFFFWFVTKKTTTVPTIAFFFGSVVFENKKKTTTTCGHLLMWFCCNEESDGSYCHRLLLCVWEEEKYDIFHHLLQWLCCKKWWR